MLDREIAAHVALLTGRDQNAAYASLLALEAESADSGGAAAYFEEFLAMLEAGSGFVRARGLRLVAKNARWVEAERLDAALPAYLRHILDEKPSTARQCVQGLRDLLDARPDLGPAVRAALEAADFSRYPDSTAPLLERDRAAVLQQTGGEKRETERQ